MVHNMHCWGVDSRGHHGGFLPGAGGRLGELLADGADLLGDAGGLQGGPVDVVLHLQLLRQQRRHLHRPTP